MASVRPVHRYVVAFLAGCLLMTPVAMWMRPVKTVTVEVPRELTPEEELAVTRATLAKMVEDGYVAVNIKAREAVYHEQ